MNFYLILLLIFLSPPSSAQPVHFAVIGDFGATGQAEADVATLVKSWSPEFIITTGDNNYENGDASTIDPNIGQYYHDFIYPYTGSYGAGATENLFWPCLGNHDWRAAGALPYLNYFTLPGNERYYDFVKGPVHFFVLDSDTAEPDHRATNSTQAAWFHNAISVATEQWKIVYFHHPPYSSGAQHGSEPLMRWPFKQWGATAVLSGHNHIYERLIEDSVLYLVNGLGGRSIQPMGAAIPGSLVRYNADYGAMLVDASDDSIRFQFITRTGQLIDSYALHRPPATTSVSIDKGWDMVSLPMHVADSAVTALFPGALSQAFLYNSTGYEPRDTMQPGIGYWLLSDSTESIHLFGDAIHCDTVALMPGWNLFGTISDPVGTDEIIEDPVGNVVSNFFGYSGTYTVADTLYPGRAYWVRATSSGQLILRSSKAFKPSKQ